MARITIGTRLQALIESPHLSQSEKRFAESLLQHYKKRNTLTRGRREWLDKLETIAATAQMTPAATNLDLIEDIRSVITRSEANSWDRGFLESIEQQVTRGKTLSPRQVETFEKIKARNTPEAVGLRKDWAATYRAEHAQTAKVVAAYYAKTGYYLDMSRLILSDDDYVPPMVAYLKMTDNDYAKKVIAAWEATPQYPLGTPVILRRGKIDPRWPRGGIVISTTEPVISAAKGAKRYKVLPFGMPEPILVEERDIKALKQLKKSSS